jgi:hypothetical protein
VNKKYDPIALEILKIARELVLNEYTDKRAQDHNKWLADFETVWKNTRIRLPYPDIPPYPTETEIVKRAQVLMDFIHDNYTEITPETEHTTESEEISHNEPILESVENTFTTQTIVEETSEEHIEESLVEVVNETIESTIKQSDLTIAQAPTLPKTKSSEGMLPSFLRKLTT